MAELLMGRLRAGLGWLLGAGLAGRGLGAGWGNWQGCVRGRAFCCQFGLGPAGGLGAAAG